MSNETSSQVANFGIEANPNRFNTVNIEEDEFEKDLNKNNEQNPAFTGPHLDKPDYANFGDYTNPLGQPGDSANPTAYAKDSAADRQTTKLADAYAKEHGLNPEGHATQHDINQMDKQTMAQANPNLGLRANPDANPSTVNQTSGRAQIAKIDPKGFDKSKEYAQAYLKEQQTGHQVYVGAAKDKQNQNQGQSSNAYDPQTLTGAGLIKDSEAKQSQATNGNITSPTGSQTQPHVTETTQPANQANPKLNPNSISNTNSKTDYGLEKQASQSDTKSQILDQLVNAAAPQSQNQNESNGPVI